MCIAPRPWPLTQLNQNGISSSFEEGLEEDDPHSVFDIYGRANSLHKTIAGLLWFFAQAPIGGGTMARRMRLSDPAWVAARDSKLWTRKESRATQSNVRQVHCPCKLCCGATLLERNTMAQHLQKFKRHPRMRGLQNVS